jgi:hypothetical protein
MVATAHCIFHGRPAFALLSRTTLSDRQLGLQLGLALVRNYSFEPASRIFASIQQLLEQLRAWSDENPAVCFSVVYNGVV